MDIFTIQHDIVEGVVYIQADNHEFVVSDENLVEALREWFDKPGTGIIVDLTDIE